MVSPKGSHDTGCVRWKRELPDITRGIIVMRFEAVASSILLIGLSCSGVQAADWYTGTNSGAGADSGYGVSSGSGHPTVAIDTALTATNQGSLYGTVIGTIAPFTPMDQSGMRLRLVGVLGDYSYIPSNASLGRITGTQEDGSFLVGYEWVQKVATLDIYAGAEASNTTLSIPDPANKTAGMSVGFKLGADFYINPTSYTMVSGNLSYSTANGGYYSRFKAGMSVAEGVFVGPEVLFIGDKQDTQTRVGLHATGFRLGMLQFGVSGGYVSDKSRGNGGYGILDARVLF